MDISQNQKDDLRDDLMGIWGAIQDVLTGNLTKIDKEKNLQEAVQIIEDIYFSGKHIAPQHWRECQIKKLQVNL